MRPADVVIVGGGIIGLAAALRLAQGGAQVTVLDRDAPGAACSTAGAGLLMAQTETPAPAPGGSPDPLLAPGLESRSRYPGFLEAIAEQTGERPALEFRGAFSLALHAEALEPLACRVAWQVSLGLSAELVPHAALPTVSGEALAAGYFPDDGWVDNQALLPFLVRAVERVATVTAHTEVTAVRVENGRVFGVECGGTFLPAGQVVLAAGAWSEALLPKGCASQGVRPARGQLLLMEAGDSAPPYPLIAGDYYVVPRPRGRVLLGATVEDAGFDVSVPETNLERIRDGVAAFLPASRNWKQVAAWSGLRPRSADDLPVIGPGAVAGLWHAGGHFRNGILLAPLTAAWLAAGILEGGMPPEAEPFSPRRFHPGKLEV